MDSALAWLGQIMAWVGQWIPRWVIVDTTHGLVKFIKGSRVVTLGPGVHFYWPATTATVLYPTARQGMGLASQTFTTRDEKTIAVSGLIVYAVEDLEKIVAHTYDPDQTIRDIAMTAIHDACCQLTWAELTEQQRTGKLDRAMRTEAAAQLRPYGVRVLKTMLTDLAPCRVIKVIQSTSQDGV